MSFGDKLFAMRKARGLTLRELAAKSGIDHSLLSKIEHDLRPDPEADLLFAILDALGAIEPVTEDELEELLSSARRLTEERAQRLRNSKSLRLFMRLKPRNPEQHG